MDDDDYNRHNVTIFSVKPTKWWLLLKLNSTHLSVYIRSLLPVWLWHCFMLSGDQERKNSERDGNINLPHMEKWGRKNRKGRLYGVLFVRAQVLFPGQFPLLRSLWTPHLQVQRLPHMFIPCSALSFWSLSDEHKRKQAIATTQISPGKGTPSFFSLTEAKGHAHIIQYYTQFLHKYVNCAFVRMRVCKLIHFKSKVCVPCSAP